MNLYPAIRFRMGDWDYYVIKMTTRELSDNVRFAYQVYEDRTLDEAIQRSLSEGRVRKEIVTYLSRQPARFFSSVVIAALKGDPMWYPVEIADDARFEIFRDDSRLNSTFGVLRFDGTQDYYALDGQHRLAAIKTLLDTSDPLSDDAPDDFANDEISVVLVVPKIDESAENFMQRYRRLFSNLNRYAKPMDQATNIIMDEDDAFAIVTRRLIQGHPFFRWDGRQRESNKIKTTKGKNLRESDAFFTSIEALYAINVALLDARYRETGGWGPAEPGEKLAEFKRFRPDEQYIDDLYDELVMYWDGLLEEIPDLHNPPSEMRAHSADDDDSEQEDSLLFWPIGQELLASLARLALDIRQDDPTQPTPESVRNALKGLGGLEWDLHRAPWRNFILVQDPVTNKWRMRSEDRTAAIRVALLIQRWLLGLEARSEDEVAELRLDWLGRLMPAPTPEEADRMWGGVLARLDSET